MYFNRGRSRPWAKGDTRFYVVCPAGFSSFCDSCSFFLLKIRGKIRHWSIEKRVAKEWGRGGGGLNPVLNTNFRHINTSLALETVFHAWRIFKGKFKISPSLCKIYASHIYFGLNYASSRHPLPPSRNTECILREKIHSKLIKAYFEKNLGLQRKRSENWPPSQTAYIACQQTLCAQSFLHANVCC